MLTDVEAELLLSCARQSLPATLAARTAEIVGSDLRWPYIIEESSRHGVAPLLFRHIESLQTTSPISADAMHELRQAYVRSAFRTRVHEEAINEVVPRLVDAGATPVLLKGAGLSRRIYKDAALRPLADIDLLIAADKIDNAKKALIACGYSLAPELLSEKFNRHYHINLPFARCEPAPVHIELHWKLTDRFSLVAFDEAELLARAHPIPIGTSNATVLDPADELVYLAAHLDNHGYANRALIDGETKQFLLHPLSGNRLIWFTDLHELISTNVDWDQVLARAKSARASAALSISLWLLNRLLGTPTDKPVLAALPLPQASWARQEFARYAQSLANAGSALASKNFQKRFLSTQKSFELRLIRLIDISQYVFPPRRFVERNYIAHVLEAARQCCAMCVELVYRRVLRALRPNTAQ